MIPNKRLSLSTLAVLSLVFAAQTCPVGTVQAPTPENTPTPQDKWVSVVLDQDHMDDGLYLDTGGDTDVELVEYGERQTQQALRTGNGRALPSEDGNTIRDFYMQFQVDDAFMYEGEPTSKLSLHIEYLDKGTDAFLVEYDAVSGGPYDDGRFKSTEWVSKTDSGLYLTAEFQLCDAYFGNRDNGADFRISDNQDGSETVRRVVVTKLLTTVHVDSCGADPYDNLPDSDAIQACIDRTCSGDTIIFTSGIHSSGYQGYLIDKTVFLVRDTPRTGLAFTSSDPENHALLQATPDLLGFVVRLYARSSGVQAGEIDDITISHLDLDGNRAERECYRVDDDQGNMVSGNWGSWLPECIDSEVSGNYGDPWCNPGTLAMAGQNHDPDPLQDYLANPNDWSTGLIVQEVTLSNTECGTALSYYGADGLIDSVIVDTAGDHVHIDDPSCTQTDEDGEVDDWADGITFAGPEIVVSNNHIMDASDVAIATFGGRDTLISNNLIEARPGNHGMFGGISLVPSAFGYLPGYQVVSNQVVNSASPVCGGIHIGINMGGHAWNAGCTNDPGEGVVGLAQDPCTSLSPSPGWALCVDPEITQSMPCRMWGYVPEGAIFTIADNVVRGAQVNFLVQGLDLQGDLIQTDNVSENPRATDWEGDSLCHWNGITYTWDLHRFVAHDPLIDDWDDQPIYCVR